MSNIRGQVLHGPNEMAETSTYLSVGQGILLDHIIQPIRHNDNDASTLR